MITIETIQENKKKFLTTVKGYNICTKELIDKLGDLGLFDAPASTMLSLHNAFPGGLIDHLLRVTGYALKLNELLPENLKQTKESVIRVSLLHSIGKVGLYTPCKSDWHIKNQGKMYEFNESLTSMTISERSLFYIMSNNNGSMLTDVEYQAIANYDKNTSDKMSEWHTASLGEILKMAIKLAIMEEKTKYETNG
jgi:hypothetical protein